MQLVKEIKRLKQRKPTGPQAESFWSAHRSEPGSYQETVLRAYAYDEAVSIGLDQLALILHLGCGTGELLADLSHQFPYVTGVEGNRQDLDLISDRFSSSSSPVLYGHTPASYYANLHFSLDQVFRPISDLTICIDVLSKIHPEDFKPMSVRIAKHTNNLILIENERTFHPWKFRHNYTRTFTRLGMISVKKYRITAPGLEPGRWVFHRLHAVEQKKFISLH